MLYSSETLKVFSETLGALYAAETPAAALQAALPGLSLMLKSRHLFVDELPHDGRPPTPNGGAQVVTEDPDATLLPCRDTASVLPFKDFTPLHEFESTGSCCEIFRRRENPKLLCLAVRLPHSTIAVTFHRSLLFTEDEAFLVGLLQPHITAVVRNDHKSQGAISLNGPSAEWDAPLAGERAAHAVTAVSAHKREKQGATDCFRLRALGFTPRECEVSFWVAQGKRDAEIALLVGCATRTVSKHVENILAKTGAETRVGATCTVQEWLRRCA